MWLPPSTLQTTAPQEVPAQEVEPSSRCVGAAGARTLASYAFAPGLALTRTGGRAARPLASATNSRGPWAGSGAGRRARASLRPPGSACCRSTRCLALGLQMEKSGWLTPRQTASWQPASQRASLSGKLGGPQTARWPPNSGRAGSLSLWQTWTTSGCLGQACQLALGMPWAAAALCCQ